MRKLRGVRAFEASRWCGRRWTQASHEVNDHSMRLHSLCAAQRVGARVREALRLALASRVGRCVFRARSGPPLSMNHPEIYEKFVVPEGEKKYVFLALARHGSKR